MFQKAFYSPPYYKQLNQSTYIQEETKNDTSVFFGNVYTNTANTSQDSINSIPPVSAGNPINSSLGPSYLKPEPAVTANPVNVSISQSAQPQADQPLPSSHAFMAWFSCLCCFWPLGLIAVYYSNKVNSAISIGDREKAILASKKAKIFSTISLVIGLNLTWIIYLINQKLTTVTYTTNTLGS
ncbi:proline-rich transmembrane protein 1-like isoform X2 [Hydra vulgaris]|uniref:Proline-rich transmembrane protein 1-like isoform X2 n=1 Tax=Hydra vulgaris TaxID=6087 RepID=A0ABM4CVL9_HYDVU